MKYLYITILLLYVNAIYCAGIVKRPYSVSRTNTPEYTLYIENFGDEFRRVIKLTKKTGKITAFIKDGKTARPTRMVFVSNSVFERLEALYNGKSEPCAKKESKRSDRTKGS